MGFIQFYIKVFEAAFSHSLETTHSVILLLIIALGIWSYFDPGRTLWGIKVSPDHMHAWQAVTAVLGAIIVVRLALAPYWIWTEQQELVGELESKRPKFELAAPGIKPLPQSPPFRLQITMQNRGAHDARDLSGQILIVDQAFTHEPGKTQFSIAGDIPPNSPTPWYRDDLILDNNIPPQYVVLGLTYADATNNKVNNQIFYMKWGGVQNGKTAPDFVYATLGDRDRILSHLKNELKQFIESTN